MKHIYITVVTILLTVANLSAQQRIDPTVEVKRDFESTLIEINKGLLETSINDTLNSLNLDFNYTIFEKPYRDMYEFSPLPSLKLKNNRYAAAPSFYAKISAGAPLATNNELYFMPLANKSKASINHNLLIGGYYNGFFGKLPLQEYSPSYGEFITIDSKVAANNSKIGAIAKYSYSWLQGELNAGVEFSNKKSLFYGYNFGTLYNYGTTSTLEYLKDNASSSLNTFIANLNIKSYAAQESRNKFKYLLDFTYKNSGNKVILDNKILNSSSSSYNSSNNATKLGENLIAIKGEFGPTIGKYNQFLIAFESQFAFSYNSTSNSYGFIEFTPQYRYENGNITLNIGANISVPYNSNKRSSKIDYNRYHNMFSPYVNFSFELAKDKLWFYAVADGNTQLNDQASLLEKNSWYLPIGRALISSTPYSFRGGFRGKFADKVSYNIYTGYAKRLGMLQFITPFDGQYFTPAYSTHSQFFAGGDINIKTESFNGGVKMQYNSYSTGKNATLLPDEFKPFGYSPLEALIYAQYTYRERITIGANLNYRYKTPTYISSSNNSYVAYLESFANLLMFVNYKINNKIGVFINGGNILNSRVQYLPFYLEQGINFAAGATIKF